MNPISVPKLQKPLRLKANPVNNKLIEQVHEHVFQLTIYIKGEIDTS